MKIDIWTEADMAYVVGLLHGLEVARTRRPAKSDKGGKG